jgi:hypothetical protein
MDLQLLGIKTDRAGDCSFDPVDLKKILRIYFNNHYGGKAVVNAMQFKEMIGVSLSADEKRVMENAKGHILGN